MSAKSVSFNPRWRYALLCASAVLVFGGCGSQGEIRQYTVEPENERIITSDVLKDEFGAIPFEWDAPKSWTLARNDQFSKVAWEVGPKVDGGRITVSAVSMGMGLASQVSRWRGQIGIEQSDQDDPMAGTEQIELVGGSATYIDLVGEEQSIQGMMFPLEDKLWVFKFRGSNSVAEEQKERFRKFCESVKVPG